MFFGSVLQKLKKSAIDVGNRFQNTNKEGSGHDGPVLTASSLDSKVREIVPKRGIEDFCRFYNREYRKYETVKKMRKSIRLMAREEFAYRRGLILTLRKLLANDEKGINQESILDLVQHEDVESIEKRLKMLQ